MLGTSVPSMNTAEPIPVPRVMMITTPRRPLPAPKAISAIPAASASLRTTTSHPVAVANSDRASVPIQLSSMFAAVRIVPLVTTPGSVIPTGPVHEKYRATSPTVAAMASGVAG